MTLTLTTDWLVYMYMLIENLLYVYIQEMKIRNYYAYFEKLTEIDIDCNQLYVDIQSNSIVEMVPQPIQPVVESELSELDDRAIGLWDELQSELEIDEDSASFVFENDFISLEGDVENDSDDCIYLQDIEEETVVAPTGYESFASAKINDNLDGPQQWVVYVIGMEDQYIHVTDGKRIWVNIGNQVSKIRNNDVLALDVIRNGKNIDVTRIFRLEVGTEVDYMIPDESYHYIPSEIAI